MDKRRTKDEWYVLVKDIVEKFPGYGAAALAAKIGTTDATFRKYAKELLAMGFLNCDERGTQAYPDHRWFSVPDLIIYRRQPLQLVYRAIMNRADQERREGMDMTSSDAALRASDRAYAMQQMGDVVLQYLRMVNDGIMYSEENSPVSGVKGAIDDIPF